MEDPSQISEYGKILLFMSIGIILVCTIILLAKFVSPKNPNPIKQSTYECGEDAVGTSWVQFNPRFYVIALVFLLFDVELVFVFPWATVFGNIGLNTVDARWGWFTLVEMGIFLGILLLGLIYVWKNGDLDWAKPQNHTPKVSVKIPASAYQKLNNTVYQVRDYLVPAVEEAPKVENTVAEKQENLGFKPRFRAPKK